MERLPSLHLALGSGPHSTAQRGKEKKTLLQKEGCLRTPACANTILTQSLKLLFPLFCSSEIRSYYVVAQAGLKLTKKSVPPERQAVRNAPPHLSTSLISRTEQQARNLFDWIDV